MKPGTCALHRIAAIGCSGLLSAAAGDAFAQSFSDLHFGPWEGSLGFGYIRDHEQVRADDGTPSTTFERHRWSEELAIANEGMFFIDPRLAAGTARVTLGLVQDREKDDSGQTSHGARLLGYEFDASLLAGMPYNGRLFAHRTQSALVQPFGHTDSTFQNVGAALHLREDSPLRDLGFPYLSANFAVEHQSTVETTTSVLGQSFRRDESQNTLSLDGHKGFETADLDARYQFTDLNDAAFAQANFQSHTLAANYSFDFGPTLNRRSDSRLFMYRRNGVSPSTLLTANENVSIAHWDNLATDYRYSLSHADTQAGPTTTNDGFVDIRYKPFRNVDTNAQAFATREQLSIGSREGYGGEAALRYRHDLPWSGTLGAHVGARYRIDQNQLSASVVNVVDELQSAPPSLGAGAGFLLAQPFVNTSSIQVVDLRGGARLIAAPDVDYEIVPEGSRVRIVPLVTSALIAANDPLAVSYTYQLDPSIKFSTAGRSAGLDFSFRWIDASYDHDVSTETLLAGEDNGLLQDVRRDTAKVDLHESWKTVDARAGAAYSRYDSQRLAYVEDRYNGFVGWRPTRNLSVAFKADRTSTDFRLPEHRTRALSAQLTIEWHVPWGFSTNALLGRRMYRDTLQPTEVITEARLGARLAYGKLNIVSSVMAAERDRGGFRTSNWGVDISVNRRF